jgi:hypothetical protein
MDRLHKVLTLAFLAIGTAVLLGIATYIGAAPPGLRWVALACIVVGGATLVVANVLDPRDDE